MNILKQIKQGLKYLIIRSQLKMLSSPFKPFADPLKNEQFDPASDNILYDEIKFNFLEIILDYKKDGVIVQDNIISR